MCIYIIVYFTLTRIIIYRVSCTPHDDSDDVKPDPTKRFPCFNRTTTHDQRVHACDSRLSRPFVSSRIRIIIRLLVRTPVWRSTASTNQFRFDKFPCAYAPRCPNGVSFRLWNDPSSVPSIASKSSRDNGIQRSRKPRSEVSCGCFRHRLSNFLRPDVYANYHFDWRPCILVHS